MSCLEIMWRCPHVIVNWFLLVFNGWLLTGGFQWMVFSGWLSMGDFWRVAFKSQGGSRHRVQAISLTGWFQCVTFKGWRKKINGFFGHRAFLCHQKSCFCGATPKILPIFLRHLLWNWSRWLFFCLSSSVVRTRQYSLGFVVKSGDYCTEVVKMPLFLQ